MTSVIPRNTMAQTLSKNGAKNKLLPHPMQNGPMWGEMPLGRYAVVIIEFMARLA